MKRGAQIALAAGFAAIVACLSFGLIASSTSAAPDGPPPRVTCHGPASLGEYFRLIHNRTIAGTRTTCRVAQKVVRSFPKACADAYAAQGSCRVRAFGLWRCRSRIVGSGGGVPSREKCRHAKAALVFTVAHFPPLKRTGGLAGPPSVDRRRQVLRGPYDQARGCVNTSSQSTLIPPDPAADSWEIHVTAGVSPGVGERLQRALIAHNVTSALHSGLDSQPLGYPRRVPIYLTSFAFDSDHDEGITDSTCDDRAVDAIVIRAEQSRREINITGAHELFHAYSRGLIVAGDPWWEEASATWFSGTVGFGEDTSYDEKLQLTGMPLDSRNPNVYPYAMSRFVQFLDDRGLIDGTSWPLQRAVIEGYNSPGATEALANAIALERSTTSLGAELGAFWGDRLRAHPLYGPQLRPTPGVNAHEFVVTAGASPRREEVAADRLSTTLVDFKLAGNVERVEFEFHPPAGAYLWGLIDRGNSLQFRDGDAVSFCTNGRDDDDFAWPGHFPVTFTNGSTLSGTVTGTITVRAQASTDQCDGGSGTSDVTVPNNLACQLLHRAGVEEEIGSGGYQNVANDRTVICEYAPGFAEPNPNGSVDLGLTRYRTSRAARGLVKTFRRETDARRVDIGDAGAVHTSSGQTNYTVAVGKIVFFLSAQSAHATPLARGVARELG